MLNFLATLGMAAIGLVVLLFLIGAAFRATALYWRQMLVGLVALIALVVAGFGALDYWAERSRQREAAEFAQKQRDADLDMAREQDERDKLRVKLVQQWDERLEQCHARQAPDAECTPIEFAIDRIEAFHAAKLPVPHAPPPPPNMDFLGEYGVLWDRNGGQFTMQGKPLSFKILAESRGKAGLSKSVLAEAAAAAKWEAIARESGILSDDDVYQRQDGEGNNAQERVRSLVNNPAK